MYYLSEKGNLHECPGPEKKGSCSTVGSEKERGAYVCDSARADCYAWLKTDGSPSVGHAFGEAELVIHMDDVAVIFDECAVEVAENLMLQ